MLLLSLRLSSVALHLGDRPFELANTGASVWFSSEVSSVIFPMKGQVVEQLFMVGYEEFPDEYFRGAVYELDGRVLAGPDIEKLLEVYK